MRILLVEDNTDLADFTAKNLKKIGFAVDVAHSGEESLRFFYDETGYDVVVLDLNLPDVDGVALLKKLMSLAANVPIMALTARSGEEDIVRGLKCGFSDYLTKPFSYHELAARLRVLCRSQPQMPRELLKIKTLFINPSSKTVQINNSNIKLTNNEFRLLYYLAKNRGRQVAPEELLRSVWDLNSNSQKDKLLTTICRLRKKVGDDPKKIIKTCEKGYIIDY